ncbi:hypothetical protein JCM10213v2_008841 [Rhodosporidiobolus nylandii]
MQIWSAHKRVCGPSRHNPFRFPHLSTEEAAAAKVKLDEPFGTHNGTSTLAKEYAESLGCQAEEAAAQVDALASVEVSNVPPGKIASVITTTRNILSSEARFGLTDDGVPLPESTDPTNMISVFATTISMETKPYEEPFFPVQEAWYDEVMTLAHAVFSLLSLYAKANREGKPAQAEKLDKQYVGRLRDLWKRIGELLNEKQALVVRKALAITTGEEQPEDNFFL